VSNIKTTLEDIIDFNKKTNLMEYIVPNNGDIIYQISAEDYFNKYKCLTPSEFEKYNGGVCWDYVIYEAANFNSRFRDIKYDTFYIIADNPPEYSTHTFLVFYLNGKVYWYESSWKPMIGIWEFDNVDDLLSYMEINHRKLANNAKQVQVIIYDALDKNFFGMRCNQYMDYMHKNFSDYVYKFNKDAKPNRVFNNNQKLPKGI